MKSLNLIGMARKAGFLEPGEEPAKAAAMSRRARLLVVAADAAGNTARRAVHFADIGHTKTITLPYTKSQMGAMTGRESLSIAALTDTGLSHALLKSLESEHPGRYTDALAAFGKSKNADISSKRRNSV